MLTGQFYKVKFQIMALLFIYLETGCFAFYKQGYSHGMNIHSLNSELPKQCYMMSFIFNIFAHKNC